MKQLSFQSPKLISRTEKNILRERLKDKRNLFYPASGTRIREGYANLPFDNILLIDRCFPEAITIKGKIICIGLEALQATALFKDINAKFAALINLNCGISEGGARYPIGSNWSLSNILPIMHDNYLHIACPEYHGKRVWKKKLFNLPQKATVLTAKDEEYINPRIFSDYYKSGRQFFVWKVKKMAGEQASFMHGTRDITVQKKNIYEDYKELDVLFVRCTPSQSLNLKSVAPKVEFIKDYSFEQLLYYCNLNKIEKIGVTPWLNHRYEGFLQYLKASEEKYPYPKTIHFYHLHNDFQQLYAKAEQAAALDS
jgi:hypothetical protein